MYLYYIRHGDPIYDPDSITEYGEKQARALMDRLFLEEIDTIISSTSNRAIMTAEPLVKKLGIEPILIDWLKEDHGWRRLSMPDENGNVRWIFMIEKYRKLFHSKEVLALGDEWYNHPCFKETRVKEEMKRVHKNVDELLKEFGFIHHRDTKSYECIRDKSQKERRIAIFAHGGMGAEFLSSILDIPYNLFSTRFEFYTTHFSIIEFDESSDLVVPRLLNFNDDSHLYKENLLEGSIYRDIKKQK